eukprot:TRINITY_DN4628_c0_g4_i1.p1 TRINITY_DN4628_c0_g4~~TRINITY_DN4628_c0_g4_i1.p1  ORF type:complete len:172 (+),score=42.46 TRINITY_DN4628_c0_g4_i1:48-518(+)
MASKTYKNNPATLQRLLLMSVICGAGGGGCWYVYNEYKVFAARVVAGLFIAFYGMWMGNGKAIPQPFGRWLEIPGLCACTWVAAHILINPPEKITSIRAVYLVGHPDPEHPDNMLPGAQETLCHVIGIFVAAINSMLLTWRLIKGTNRARNKPKMQ